MTVITSHLQLFAALLYVVKFVGYNVRRKVLKKLKLKVTGKSTLKSLTTEMIGQVNDASEIWF